MTDQPASPSRAAATPAAPRADVGVARPLPVGAVRLLPTGVLGAWQDRNAQATIPHCIDQLEAAGNLDNYRRLVGDIDPATPYRGFIFADSDVHKVIEAVAWEIGRSGTTAFDGWLDEVIDLLARAQEPDGYLMTAIQAGLRERWADLENAHELYVLGHMVQAAVALQRCAGRDDLLRVALRFVDLVDATFGPDGERVGICGHPEIETALVELYRETGEQRHLALAQHMIDLRGTGTLVAGGLGPQYFQDHEPVRQARTVAGHAVRQLYLAAGATDVYLETGEAELLDAMHDQWVDAHERKMYISGAFGSRHRDEAFGSAYELPSDRAYAETCATIADLHWSWRMFLADGGSRYGDVVEREIHNALAASLDAGGTRFFYANPLQSRPDKHSEESAPRERLPWYPCACCPPNIARAVAQMGAYVASVTDSEIAVHQFADADIDLPEALGSGTVRVRTRYPEDGVVEVMLDGTAPAGARLALRVPAWSTSTTVDGRAADPDPDGYLRVPLADGARLELDVAPRWTVAHPRVDAVRGCVALERGPLVYAIEQADMPDGVEVDDVRVHTDSPPRVTEGGVTVSAVAVPPPSALYATLGSTAPAPALPVTVTAIPFATWGNRTPGAMRVWLPTAD